MENDTISELISSLNKSIDDIRKHPTKVERIPTNFEIMVRGVSNVKGIEALFSPKLDELIFKLFDQIQNGNFEAVLANQDKIKDTINAIFGEGSFQGPISQSVLASIQASVSSEKYNKMKSILGKNITTMKKVNLVLKNLKKTGESFKDNPEMYKKYKDAVYAIKQVLKLAAVVYRNRSIINRKVFNGLNNIVHESFEVDEPLIGWED